MNNQTSNLKKVIDHFDLPIDDGENFEWIAGVVSCKTFSGNVVVNEDNVLKHKTLLPYLIQRLQKIQENNP